MEALALSPEVMGSSATVPTLATEFGAGIKAVLGTEIAGHSVAYILGATAVIGVGIYAIGAGIRKIFGGKSTN
ncbi:MAG: hypothetical protein HOG89_04235 [Candidatus Peribacter sp.]|jgi:hypothetical protein|nr:hypothetical protein [Candidatus Peribacter sp.]MBT4393376.1 hypothetical protein [Candidatus Peribacter sp.]MBT4600785.1 hypothetical protein [Candidatus Peribacter sp.]MBT5149169.1 hypothetical protein [Candidatus Peribacter sp.]MBT5637858.1 hypothetical protein [Candidatus Peribacter sp.]